MQPWLGKTLHQVGAAATPAWREVQAEYADRVKDGDLVIASEGAPLTFYGMKNLKYKINNFDENLDSFRYRSGQVEFVTDDYAGIPILTNLPELEGAVKTGFKNNVWFFFSDNVFLNPKAMPQDIKNFLVRNGEWFTASGREILLSSYAIPKNSILVCRVPGELL
jgi:hypothetical protein